MKNILKKIWLPAVVVAVVTVSSVALAIGIGSSQDARQAEAVVSTNPPEQTAEVNETETPSTAEETPLPTLSPVEEAEQTPLPTALATEIPNTMVYDIEILPNYEDNPVQPGANEIDHYAAADSAAELLNKVFGDVVSGKTFYVRYNKYEGMLNGLYEVLIGSPDNREASYICSVDAVGGNACSTELNSISKYEQTNFDSDMNAMEAARDDEKYTDITRKLIEENFANGRKTEEITVDGIQWAFSDEYDLLVDCKVRMSEGECYLVRITSNYDIQWFNAYPLGWESCRSGDYFGAELNSAGDSSDGLDSAPGIETAVDGPVYVVK